MPCHFLNSQPYAAYSYHPLAVQETVSLSAIHTNFVA